MDVTEATWRKSSRSSEQGDACIEVSLMYPIVAVRDSKDPNGPKIFVSRGDFKQFAEALKSL